jgi:PAS domain S-box-containing protein
MQPSAGDVRSVQGESANADSVSAEIIGILDTIDLPIIVVGRDWTVARFNQAATDALGLTVSDIGRRFCDIRALADIKEIEKLCAQVMADGAPCRRDIRNGDRWFLLRIAPYLGSDGQMRGAVLTFTNVTGFRESIGQAIYEREYTKAILNTVNDALVVLDADLRVQTTNRTFYAMFGVSREETQGVPLCSLGDHDWKALGLWESLKATIFDNREFQTVEIEREFPTIGRRTLLLDARRLSPNGSALILLVLRDVTERREAEEKLRESEQRFRSLVFVITDVPWTTDAKGAFVGPQPEWSKFTGQSWEEYCGFGWANALHPEDRPQIQEIWKRACEARVLYEAHGRLWHAPSQQYRHFFARATPLLNSDGSVREWVGTCTDCHDQKIAEEELHNAQKQLVAANELLTSKGQLLEKMVERRTAELRETVQQLETFSYSIVHDMRAPLRSMRSFASVIEQEYRDKLDEEGRSYLNRIMGSASRMDALITDVLAYSRIAMQQTDLGRVDLDKLVSEIVEQYPQFQERTAAIEIAHPLPSVCGNTALLTQVLSNLLDNALKFMPPGREPRVVVRAENFETRVRVWVQDNGIGIDPRFREKIFNLFQRLHRPDEYSGTGVGLAIVKKAVERIGGTVGFESEKGQGSRFWFELEKAEPILKNPVAQPTGEGS